MCVQEVFSNHGFAVWVSWVYKTNTVDVDYDVLLDSLDKDLDSFD